MEAFRSIQFDVVFAQDASARIARGLVRIDEENFLADESRSATQGWLVHTTLPRLESPLGERWLGRIVRAEGEGVNRNRDSGSGHPLALPHYGREVIMTICCGNNLLSVTSYSVDIDIAVTESGLPFPVHTTTVRNGSFQPWACS
jgi:hypothetical protein